MNAVSRPLLAAACLIFVLLPGFDAHGQFIPDETIQAPQIDAAMLQQIDKVVTPAMQSLTAEDADPRAIVDARVRLLRQLENPNASAAFLDTISRRITAKMDSAVNHDSVLVRMNAMIILSRMTDEGSLDLINAGLVDDNVAVQRWAMEALARRVVLWKTRNVDNLRTKLKNMITQVDAKLGQPPHPIVVTPALRVYIAIDTPESREALIAQLDKRLELHKQNPGLSYAPEQTAIARFAPIITISSPYDIKSGTGLNRIAFQNAMLIIKQAKANAFDDETLEGAMAMLNQSVLSLGQVAAGARKQSPPDQANVTAWIKEGALDRVEKLLTDEWAVILRAAPFSLTNDELGLE